MADKSRASLIPDVTPLQTERLLLRQRSMEHFADLIALNSDLEVMQFIMPVGSAEEVKSAARERILHRFPGGLGYWSVFHRDEPNRFLGYVGIIPANRIGPQIELTYRFHQQAQGRGIAFEAVSHVVEFGFRALKLPSIEIHTHPENRRSLALAARLGFIDRGAIEVSVGIWRLLVREMPTPARRDTPTPAPAAG